MCTRAGFKTKKQGMVAEGSTLGAWGRLGCFFCYNDMCLVIETIAAIHTKKTTTQLEHMQKSRSFDDRVGHGA
jgi:hypothetical protein